MTDFSAQFANRFESTLAEQNQPATDIVNARLQRIEELERVRQERLASHNTTNSNDASSRLQRRERLIRQSTQSRSMERRSFASNIQRTPVVRSQTLETSAPINEDNLNFREIFESTRQNLFGPRVTASSENLSSFHRSSSDTRLMRAPVVNIPQETDSGSSTPRSNVRPTWDIASGLAEAFSSVRSSLRRPETSSSAVELSRSPSTVRESRNSSTNIQRFIMSSQTSSPLTRSASVRESRRETRLRRRTIEGVDSNVTRALERERMERTFERERMERTPSASRASSATRTQSFNRTQAARTQVRRTVSQENEVATEVSVSEATTESQSTTYTSNGYTPYTRGRRSVEIFPDDSVPVLGLEEEKVKFIDSEGHCHWLSKHHQLLRLIKSTNVVPEIKKVKLQSTESSETDGYIASLEGDLESRYKKLGELVHIARKQGEILDSGDQVDSEHRLSLLELYQRGDFLDEKQNGDTDDIDEKYKTVSLYTAPRSRPDLEEYLSTRVVVPLYDGIERPTEEKEKTEAPVVLVPRGPVQYQLSASRMTGRQFTSSTTSMANGGTSIVSQRIAQARQNQMAVSATANGQAMSYQSSEQSSYSQEVTEEFDNNNTIEISGEDSEVNLVMERIQMMEEASGQEIDTSHLDYEEMLMIQRALEENPSPPETPEPMSPSGEYFVEEPQDTYAIHEEPSVPAPSVLPRMNSAPAAIGSATPPFGRSSTVSQAVNHSEARSVLRSFSSDGNQRTEQTVSQVASQSVSSTVTNTNNSIQTVHSQSEVFSESSTSTVTSSESSTDPSTSGASAVSTSSSRDSRQSRPFPNRVSMSPRLQRISSSGSDTVLPLPSMDFSPLSKSPKRFNFNDASPTETVSEVLNSGNETSGQNQTPANPDLQKELTIEIPEESDTVGPLSSDTRHVQGTSQGQSTSTPPAVKPRNPSVASNDSVSPAGSDVVTTVFEEFVQTIPRDLLSNWSPSQNDER